MKKGAAKESVLGVMVSGRALHATLLRNGESGPEVVRYFSRQIATTTSGMPVSPNAMVDDDESLGTDFTIKFGAGNSSSDLFLSSEFSGDQEGGEGMGGGSGQEPVVPFDVELEDILGECRDLGFVDPLIAFCEGSSYATSVEVRVEPSADDEKKKKKAKVVGHQDLVKIANEQLGLAIELEGAGFIEMAPAENGVPRYLAIVEHDNSPVAQTLTMLRSKRSRMPAARLLDNEVSIYLGLARAAFYLVSSDLASSSEFGDESSGVSSLLPGDSRKTLLVRAGLEDTLVLFLEDDKLLHFECLRSITTYEAPETICSRVLLLQDEYGIGDVQHVLLLSDDREDAIVESFRMFFSDTRVESLREFVPRTEIAEGGYGRSTADVLATGVALRLSNDDLYHGSFEDINLLPRKLLKRKLSLPVTWHVFALYGFMFASALFWVARFFTMEAQVRERRRALDQYPAEYTEADPAALKARVDSLNAVTQGYKRALRVLDSLLVGSDAWSRSLEKTSAEVSAVRGIWIDNWRPQGQQLILIGNATSRDRIVELARRTDSDIQSVTFSEIRDWPVFSFTMKMPVPSTLPEAARYLREQVQVISESTTLGQGGVGTN